MVLVFKKPYTWSLGVVIGMGFRRSTDFWVILTLIILSIIASWANYAGLLGLHVRVGSFFIHHWFSLTGSFYIAIFTLFYYIMKRRNPKATSTLLKLHMYGNVVSFGLISIHFAQQISRPAQFYPSLQTGLALYPIVALLVASGFLMRFRVSSLPQRSLRFLHVSLTTAYYFTIWVHILHGLGWINA
jgi:hypothetical protein